MDQNLKDILETVIFIKEHMLTKNEGATKDDVRSIIQQLVPEIVAVELGPVHQRLREINQRLDVLDEHYKNLKGVTKEIDEVRARVRDIEKHFGLNKKIAA
jgi:hypothetical protein